MNDQTPRKFATTPGTRDVLPPESTRLLDVQAKIRERFRLFGYGEVLTPALEYSEVVEEPKLRDVSFKLFDPDNQMLLLRPEMTTPVARLVAQRLRNFPPPYNLSYVLPVYRRASVGRGRSPEPTGGCCDDSPARGRHEYSGPRSTGRICGRARADGVLRVLPPARRSRSRAGPAHSARGQRPRAGRDCSRRVAGRGRRSGPGNTASSRARRRWCRVGGGCEAHRGRAGRGGGAREPAEDSPAPRRPRMSGRGDTGPRSDRAPQLLHGCRLRGVLPEARVHCRERGPLRQPPQTLWPKPPRHRLRHLSREAPLGAARREHLPAARPRRRERRSYEDRCCSARKRHADAAPPGRPHA